MSTSKIAVVGLGYVGLPLAVALARHYAVTGYDHDPQLKHLNWLTDLPHSEMGTWPVKELPTQFSETPAYMGGLHGRAGPCYGEDNAYVFGEILGLSTRQIQELREAEVL